MSLRRLYLQWKSLRLPWRRRFLVGEDLQGNTFWEFQDPLSPRMRRTMEPSRKLHHADVVMTPAWHQWLRHTRPNTPSIQEQQMEVIRQRELIGRARLADERWEKKARYIEKPKKEETEHYTFGGNREVAEGQETILGGDAPKTEPDSKEGVRNIIQSQGEAKDLQDPWEEQRLKDEREDKERKEREKKLGAGKAPGQEWQPESWTPGKTVPRRRGGT